MYPSQSQQPQPPATPPPDDCPDPNPPFTRYRVTVAVAQQRAQLYVADIAVIQPRYDKIAGAQGRFAAAKSAQKQAFEELKQRVERIAGSLSCDLSDEVREHLRHCWDQLNQETTPPAALANCTDIDQLGCDHLPEDAARLHTLSALATTCVAAADAAFDALAGLPDGLTTLITELLAKATALEQEICTTRSDLARSFVEYVGLRQRFDALEYHWTAPTTYGCRLKVAFHTLLHRHVVAICLAVEIFRQDQWTRLAEEARQAKKTHLIDLVLECARPSPPGGQYGGQSPPPQDQSAPAQRT